MKLSSADKKASAICFLCGWFLAVAGVALSMGTPAAAVAVGVGLMLIGKGALE